MGILGKYTDVRDAYASIDKALEHCGSHLDAEIEQQSWLETTGLRGAGQEPPRRCASGS